MRVSLLVVVVLTSAATAAASDCTTGSQIDCSGNDLVKITNKTSLLTADACCALCEQHKECVVAVLAPQWQGELAMCMLKGADCKVRANYADRVRICPPKSKSSSLCTAVTPAPPTPAPSPCDATKLPIFCDPSKNIAERTAEIVGKLTVDEKVAQVGSNGVPGVDRLGIPDFQWWGEALHGVCQSPSVHFKDPTPNGTSFPEIIGVGATFDKELFAAMGNVVGSEARVMMNAGNAGGTFWAPNINIVKVSESERWWWILCCSALL